MNTKRLMEALSKENKENFAPIPKRPKILPNYGKNNGAAVTIKNSDFSAKTKEFSIEALISQPSPKQKSPESISPPLQTSKNYIPSSPPPRKRKPTWPNDLSKQAPKESFDKYDWECLHRPMNEVIASMSRQTQKHKVYADIGKVGKSTMNKNENNWFYCNCAYNCKCTACFCHKIWP